MMKKGHGLWHGLLMVICCLVPLALVFMFVGQRGGLGGGVSWIFLLLCPLMHIFMMKGMMGGHDKHENHRSAEKPHPLGGDDGQ